VGARSRSPWLRVLAAALLAAVLTGCAPDHGDPWVNPGQQARLGDAMEQDEDRQQQLRDRAQRGQRQR